LQAHGSQPRKREFVAVLILGPFIANPTALTGGRESGSVTLEEKRKFLLEHVRSRIGNTNSKPDIVSFIEALSTIRP
jgi:hypothetical protein